MGKACRPGAIGAPGGFRAMGSGGLPPREDGVLPWANTAARHARDQIWLQVEPFQAQVVVGNDMSAFSLPENSTT
jgi:hypothetical protein